MEDHVRFQVLLRREFSVAELANKRGVFRRVLTQHVLTQSVFGCEGLTADFAREEEFIGSALVREGVVAAGSDAAGCNFADEVRKRCGQRQRQHHVP